jgi:NTP pyrophosphatase (non-canonical NTP hydrolase)
MHTKFIKYGTPAEKLAEECAEVIQACMKVQRFGLDDHNPLKKTRKTNREKIFDEMNDVENAIKNMREWIESIPMGSQIFRDQGEDYE